MTAAQARLTPDNAVTEIDRLIPTAWREKLPVYMELPSDIAYLDIEVPAAPLVLAEPPSDPERLRSCAAAIAGRLSAAKSPAILVDWTPTGSAPQARSWRWPRRCRCRWRWSPRPRR